MSPDTSNTLCRTPHRLEYCVSWLYAHSRQTLWRRPRDAKAKLDSCGHKTLASAFVDARLVASFLELPRARASW
jgi:hypothetical protein